MQHHNTDPACLNQTAAAVQSRTWNMSESNATRCWGACKAHQQPLTVTLSPLSMRSRGWVGSGALHASSVVATTSSRQSNGQQTCPVGYCSAQHRAGAKTSDQTFMAWLSPQGVYSQHGLSLQHPHNSSNLCWILPHDLS
jgi:hypothetical protein